MLGNMLAKNETDELNRSFSHIEWFLHTLVTLVFSVTAVLIVPFVRVYTADISDANYIVPSFAYLITIAQAAYCLRLPYNIMILAAGHYKQTQWSAIIEAVINIVVSVVLVFNFGLIGVAIGTFAAMVYRTVYLAWYLSRNIIYRDLKHFLKHILTDIVCVIMLFSIVKLSPAFFTLRQISYASWLLLAVKVGCTALFLGIAVNAILYKREVSDAIKKIRNKI